MQGLTLAIFCLVYAGMVAGRVPRLNLDRTGIALLGALALLAIGRVDLEEAAGFLDYPTLALLFAFMILSAQLRLGGFYTRIVSGITNAGVGPTGLLASLVFATGALSAIFTNDVICVAVTPLVLSACARRGWNPVPFLLALACASNIGSAATLIGNPQNIYLGASMELSFRHYILTAGPAALAGLAALWGTIVWQYRGRWMADGVAAIQSSTPPRPFDAWQSGKGIFAVAVLLALFLFSPIPRTMPALAFAGLMLCSRKMHSREMLGQVDWQVLVLFIGLFVVNGAFQLTDGPQILAGATADLGLDLDRGLHLGIFTVLFSNLVSNVPAVMLLAPLTHHPDAGTILAISSTLAGNLFVVGSIANIIVVESARRHGINISWKTHAATGIPVTLITLAIAALVLAISSGGST